MKKLRILNIYTKSFWEKCLAYFVNNGDEFKLNLVAQEEEIQFKDSRNIQVNNFLITGNITKNSREKIKMLISLNFSKDINLIESLEIRKNSALRLELDYNGNAYVYIDESEVEYLKQMNIDINEYIVYENYDKLNYNKNNEHIPLDNDLAATALAYTLGSDGSHLGAMF